MISSIETIPSTPQIDSGSKRRVLSPCISKGDSSPNINKNSDRSIYASNIYELYIYSSIHGCIDQIIPTSYKFFEVSIGLSPKSLGLMSFVQKLTQGFFTLFSGIICDREITKARNLSKANTDFESLIRSPVNTTYNNLGYIDSNINFYKETRSLWPSYFMIITSIGWGSIMIAMIFASTLSEMCVLLFCLGMFMSLMGPLTQSIIGTFGNLNRGRYFGNLFLSQNIGRISCLFITTNLLGEYFTYRLAMLLFAMISFSFALYIYIYDIYYSTYYNNILANKYALRTIKIGEDIGIYNLLNFLQLRYIKITYIKESLIEYSYIIYNKSAWLMLIMSIVNGIPRHSLNFTMMWLQYCGLSSLMSTIVYSSSWIAAIIISPIVGKVADYTEFLSPKHGRQFMAQSAIFLRIILMVILLLFIPWGRNSFIYYIIISILIGFMAGWPGVGASRPILCEIVKPQHRGTFFAVFSLFETIGSALFGAPFVGILAQNYFGYISFQENDTQSIINISNDNVKDIYLLQNNAQALAKSMLCMTVGPWLIAILLFGLLHCTYSNDQDITKDTKVTSDD
ncbi:major facilitator superfamily transporter [Cryptosporidium andersoni]|uniref:Major facilitator superfamily transporter n=1 Tax=Cryptosporidium andersoni TaxID=117008 RepID=A0A1J4MP82_9CRYT|nr:major facilitator superfamily transporter [Cryptosporidium andersoni]